MIYVPVPVHLLEVGRTIPVDIWDKSGKLLLRKGHGLQSEQHREMLAAHEASMTQSDAQAWQRSHERLVHAMLRAGRSTLEIAQKPMPEVILESDYLVGPDDQPGSWLVLRERLQGLLYQAQDAHEPAQRIEGLQRGAVTLLAQEPDQSLFVLFQSLADPALGYCATHALLSAVVCELTAEKVGMPISERQSLFTAALLMNIGMARAQDGLSQQNVVPNDVQRHLIREHPERSVDILRGFGLADENLLDIVRWHHEPEAAAGSQSVRQGRRMLRVADVFVAKLAARKTRLAMSPLGAAKAMVLDSAAQTSSLASAVATAVGFYPPGTYVQLVSGERAVVVARGPRAHDAHVVSIISAGGMPLAHYQFRDVRQSRYAIRAPVNAEKIKVLVNVEKAFKAWSDARD